MTMRTMGDWELLQNYSQTRSEAAFAELVQRHINWIYSVALRQVGNPELAEEVVQSVFALLARKAPGLRPGTVLVGWLFRSTSFVAKCALRAERRRKNREEMAAAMMTTAQTDETEFLWERLAPHLDQAVASLSEADRSAVLLRFYQKKSLSEVGQHLGISEEAAKKRVSRTVERLRACLTRRGVTLGGAVLGGLLVEKTVQAAPAAATAAVIKTSAAGVAANLPQLARDTLCALRWAKLRLVTAGGVSLLLVAMLWPNAGATRSLGSDHLAAQDPKPSLLAQATSGSTEVFQEPDPPVIRETPRFLFRAVAADTGRGIAAARVPVNFVIDGEWIRAEDLVTDGEGLCAVPLPTGRFTRLDVGVLMDGFVQKFYTWREDHEEALPSVYVLKLERAVSIGGRVQDPAGNPVSNAEIGLNFYGAGDASFREPARERFGFVDESVTAARTDAQGNWRCALTPPAYTDFSVSVQHPNFVRTTFTPETVSQAAPGPGRLRMEDLWTAKAVMPLEPGFELTGLVLDDTGNSLAGARVSWMGNSGHEQAGVRTGPDGSFRMMRLPQGAAQMSAWAKGFAPSLMAVQINSTAQTIVLRLNRGASVSFRLTDEDGAGIPGAWAVMDLPVSHNGDFRVTAGADGRASFEGIPTNALNSLVLHAGAKGFFYSRNLRLNAAAREQDIRLVKSLRVSGNVLDADTLAPVPDFKAIPCRGLDSSGYDRSATRAGQSGTYAVDFSEPEAPFRVRIEAEGYEPAMSPPMSAHPSEQEQDFRLRRKDTNRGIRGSLFLSDGRPAAHTSVALLSFEQGAVLYQGTFKRGDGAILATTDGQGDFKFDSDPQAHTIVAADPVSGFALMRIHRSIQPFRLQLQPWGRIEGRVVLSGNPAPNQQVTISSGFSAYRSVGDGLYAASGFIKTDGEGRFVCEMVPPGEATLHLAEGTGQPLSHQTVAEVFAGETAQVQIGGRGRLVTGKLAMTDGSKMDWQAQLIIGSLATDIKTPADQPPPHADDFAARLRLLDFFDESAEWRAYERAAESFPLQVAADGSFTVEDVPPGPYRLTVSLAASLGPGEGPTNLLARFRRRTIASLREDVVVPGEPGDSAPVDLGILSVKPELRVQN